MTFPPSWTCPKSSPKQNGLKRHRSTENSLKQDRCQESKTYGQRLNSPSQSTGAQRTGQNRTGVMSAASPRIGHTEGSGGVEAGPEAGHAEGSDRADQDPTAMSAVATGFRKPSTTTEKSSQGPVKWPAKARWFRPSWIRWWCTNSRQQSRWWHCRQRRGSR